MKKYILVTVLILSLLLASCGKKETVKTPSKVDRTVETQETTTEKTTNTNNEEEITEGKVNGTMMEIFKKGKPTNCTFKTTDEQGQIYDAVMYIDGKNMRYTMMGEIEGKKFENNMIIKDGYTYNWSNMAPGGFKMKQNLDESNDNSEKSEGASKDMSKTLEFDCKKGADSAMFELPKDIEFQEFDLTKIPKMPSAQ